MVSLDLFGIFARVAETGSFSRAARDLGLSKATVSKRVAELEAGLGVALVARTTRRATLTEAGERLLTRAQRILEEAEAAREEAGEARANPRGRLRIAAPLSFGIRYLGPLIPEFLAAFPDIQLELSFSDETVDLVGEGFDAAVRVRILEDSSLVARKLAPVRTRVVASCAYWQARGKPQRPEDLAMHACFHYANATGGTNWRFDGPSGAKATVRIQPRLVYDNADAIGPALCAGLGVARQPDFIAFTDINAGRLEPVLDDWAGPEAWLHVLTPPGRAAPRKLRAFSDFMHDHFGGGRAPWLAG